MEGVVVGGARAARGSCESQVALSSTPIGEHIARWLVTHLITCFGAKTLQSRRNHSGNTLRLLSWHVTSPQIASLVLSNALGPLSICQGDRGNNLAEA
ncbi:hypothetical protein A0H81_11066 [Grifola frondosa]|uniref:Uncharacterized protein n=1 Tax=Grifola frondosa TaxID=5627 RepID=A0A1C7LVB8_GRIFR|nr:hypothetical protein A0H81_11066 [Grifola frondosa]